MDSIFSFPEDQIQLCYACLICVEVLPISLMVYHGWRPVPNDWYSGDRLPDSSVGQLASEHIASVDWHSFVASRQPTAMVDDTTPLGSEVAATIELRGRVSAQEGRALEDLVNSMSKTMTAVYKPAALFRSRHATGASGAYLSAAASSASSFASGAVAAAAGSSVARLGAGATVAAPSRRLDLASSDGDSQSLRRSSMGSLGGIGAGAGAAAVGPLGLSGCGASPLLSQRSPPGES
eukprot:TRINITY_DN19243_c0_g1_i2.p1 TRINITY_DN19243_c0_g1~~TRINITY_DN19243_c0_g1_i2.p1  ORF type:complete len:236 (-),score=53.46 TRINITY_DN19243_c0_g1_i2:82-789(-)